MEVAAQIRFFPRWEYVDTVRRFVQDYSRTRLGRGPSERLTIVAQEFLENVAKYGDPASTACLELLLDVPARIFELHT